MTTMPRCLYRRRRDVCSVEGRLLRFCLYLQDELKRICANDGAFMPVRGAWAWACVRGRAYVGVRTWACVRARAYVRVRGRVWACVGMGG